MKTYSCCLLFLGALLINVQPAAGQVGNFAPAVALGVGSAPAYALAADVNGDGQIELISANTGDATLTVLTNNGSGVYSSNATLVVDAFPICIATVDANSDGKLDLVSANFGLGAGNTLTVLTNNGNGEFGSNATLVVGASPFCIATADVNGDGRPDLISANTGAGTLTVLTNNGSGSFGYNATLNVGTGAGPYPQSVTAADLNGDGKPDLISANTGEGTLTVLTNNGSGGFGYNATLSVGSGPASVVAADLNGDGKLDLVCANYIDSTLMVLTNNGDGILGFNATLQTGNGPNSVVAADVNGDGKPDLISANANDSTLTVLTNDGSGGFALAATPTVGNGPNSVVAADVNADGLPDLISANYSDNTLSVLLNGVTGSGAPPTLAIHLADPNTLVVSWPSPSDGFGLQFNSDLGTTNWSDFAGTVDDNGSAKSTTISPPAGNLFFRLFHP